MFDNRWDNWAGDFADSFAATQVDPAARRQIPEILAHFGASARRLDPKFPDSARPGTIAAVLRDAMPRLALPDAARPHAREVVALFLDYLRETGRVGEGAEWAEQVRNLPDQPDRVDHAAGAPKGVTIKKDAISSGVGRNDPCPCGSGKKFKKCCYALGA